MVSHRRSRTLDAEGYIRYWWIGRRTWLKSGGEWIQFTDRENTPSGAHFGRQEACVVGLRIHSGRSGLGKPWFFGAAAPAPTEQELRDFSGSRLPVASAGAFVFVEAIPRTSSANSRKSRREQLPLRSEDIGGARRRCL